MTPGGGKLTLTWQAPSSWGTWPAVGYPIEWRSGSGITWSTVHNNAVDYFPTTSETSFEFTSQHDDVDLGISAAVTSGTAYQLRIQADSQQPSTDGTQRSHYRHSSWVTLSNLVPGTPGKTTGLSVTAGSGKLDLSWAAPASNGSAMTGYDVHYKTSAAADQTGTGSDPTTGWVAASHGGTAATGSIASLPGGTAYDVRVQAKDTHGAGKRSDAPAGTPTALSSNANLGGLTASTSTSAGGAYSALGIGTFSASTTNYTATGPNATTHAKLTPTAADTGKATVAVQGPDVTSGSASAAIALSEGPNALTVRVTAEDSTTQDYTVTITRQALPQLTGPSLSAAGNAVTPSPAFAGGTTVDAATVPHDATSVSLTPTWTGSVSKAEVGSSTPNWAATITSSITITSSGGAATAGGGGALLTVMAYSLPGGLLPTSVRVNCKETRYCRWRPEFRSSAVAARISSTQPA